MQKLTYNFNKRNYLFCSNFFIKLYKKFLSLKLTVYFNKCKYNNIKNSNIKFKRKLYLINLKFFIIVEK